MARPSQSSNRILRSLDMGLDEHEEEIKCFTDSLLPLLFSWQLNKRFFFLMKEMNVIPFTFIEDKHSVLIYIIVTFLKCTLNYIFESEWCFKKNRAVNLNDFVVRNSFENLKEAMDIPWEKHEQMRSHLWWEDTWLT